MKKLFLLLPLWLALFASHGQTTDSLDIKIGQMLMVGFSGQHLDPADPIVQDIRQGRLGGVILFAKNIADTNSVIRLKQLTYGLQAQTPVPLFIAIDQEGGRVNRLKPKYGFPKSVTAAYLGALNNPDTTRFYAQLTAGTLAALGFNVNFAPVLDLASNPDNPIIAKYERAYSADPRVVATHAGITIRQHSRLKVITVGKHFPGHGSSQHDTHKGMADVTDTWQPNELFPYDSLIRAGLLNAVMSAHIVNRQLEPAGLPGTLSQRMLDSLLRQQLGFKGVVFSDDMQMHAITRHYGLEKAIELGLNAGLDVIIFSNNIQGSEERTVDAVHRIIRQLVEEGRISKERIEASYQRIMQLKKAFLYE